MALERKDVRAKLDHDMHAALSVFAQVDQIDIGEFIERELLKVLKQRIHDAMLASELLARSGITGRNRE